MTSSSPLVVIPSRLKATRLPNKPLADIHGEPMIVHVWRKAIAANIGPVIVAAGDPEIVDVITSVGGIALLTDPALASGTDRVKAAIDMYDPQMTHDIVINLQGDLPTIDPLLIQEVLSPFQDPKVDIGTLGTLMDNMNEIQDPNVVKIAITTLNNNIGRALYFSRTPIPAGDGPFYHHIGLYSYRRNCLNEFVRLSPDTLEEREKLEQLRALANGFRIDVKIIYTKTPFGVDTLEDLTKARQFLSQNT